MSAKLTDKELSYALDAVYRINATEDVDAYARTAQSLLCGIIQCKQEIFTVIDEVDGVSQTGATYQWGAKARYLREFKERGYEREMFLAAMQLKPNSCATRDSDVMSDQDRLESRLYQEIYKPQGVFYVLRITLIWHEKMIGQFTFFKEREAGDFSDRDLQIGALFAPHLALKLGQLKDTASMTSSSTRLKDVHGLTSREAEVVSLVVDGLSDEEIAEKLFISDSTVKKHLYNAYAKIGVSNRLQLKISVSGRA